MPVLKILPARMSASLLLALPFARSPRESGKHREHTVSWCALTPSNHSTFIHATNVNSVPRSQADSKRLR